jgi:RNA polymerase sigma-70 factor (ECF subfamily)
MTKFDDRAILLMLRNPEMQDEAVRILFEEYSTTIRLQAYRLLRDFHMADDITQDVFHDFWRTKYFMENDITSFSAYLMGMCRNICADYIERHQARASHGKDIAYQYQATNQEEPRTDGDLNRYIALLPERWRDAVVLVFVNDLPHAHAAKYMNVTPKAIERLLYRAKKYLATKLHGDK